MAPNCWEAPESLKQRTTERKRDILHILNKQSTLESAPALLSSSSSTQIQPAESTRSQAVACANKVARNRRCRPCGGILQQSAKRSTQTFPVVEHNWGSLIRPTTSSIWNAITKKRVSQDRGDKDPNLWLPQTTNTDRNIYKWWNTPMGKQRGISNHRGDWPVYCAR